MIRTGDDEESYSDMITLLNCHLTVNKNNKKFNLVLKRYNPMYRSKFNLAGKKL
jgi:hypothetical protein